MIGFQYPNNVMIGFQYPNNVKSMRTMLCNYWVWKSVYKVHILYRCLLNTALLNSYLVILERWAYQLSNVTKNAKRLVEFSDVR